MIEKAYAHKPAQITFTADSHELLTGDLRPGHEVTLRYDPRRIVPADDPYVFGDPKRPIDVHVQFHKDGPISSQEMTSPAGILTHPPYDATGQGPMLVASFSVPDNAERVVVWFTFLAKSGEIVVDNDHGVNYYFGFPSRDIHILEATVVANPAKSSSEFAVRISTIDAVEAVSVRFRIVGESKFGKPEVPLLKTGQKDQNGLAIWSVSGVTVPEGSTVQFKVFSWMGGLRYKDDNGGRYYLAPQPPAEDMGPPPQELMDAAAKWKL